MEIIAANAAGKVRRETLWGRSFLVAPSSLIVPGVLNGSRGALYYPPTEISKPSHVDQWNGMPLVVHHPVVNGEHASARRADVLRDSGIGWVFNAAWKGYLYAEPWFDEDLTAAYDRRLPVQDRILPRLRSGQPIELSTGLFTTNMPVPKGLSHNGKPYDFVARHYRSDHLAVLPNQRGACSIKDGCGVGMLPNAAPGAVANARKATVTGNFNPNQPRDEDGRFASGRSMAATHATVEAVRQKTKAGYKTAAAAHKDAADAYRELAKSKTGDEAAAYLGYAKGHDRAMGELIRRSHGLPHDDLALEPSLKPKKKGLIRRLLGNFNPNQPRDEDGRFAASRASGRAQSASLAAKEHSRDAALDAATERVRKAANRARSGYGNALPSLDAHVKAGKAHQKARAEHQRLRDVYSAAPEGSPERAKYLKGVSAHSLAATAHRVAADAHFAAAESFKDAFAKKSPTSNAFDPRQARDADGKFKSGHDASRFALGMSQQAGGSAHAVDAAAAAMASRHDVASVAHGRAARVHRRAYMKSAGISDPVGTAAQLGAATAHEEAAAFHGEQLGPRKKSLLSKVVRFVRKATMNDDPVVNARADVSPAKACEILRDGTAQGHKLTRKQRGMFGAICGQRRKVHNRLTPLIRLVANSMGKGKKSSPNCGIGAGGFQPGNTCASGGGGGAHSAYAAIKKIGDDAVADIDSGKAVSDHDIADRVRRAIGDADPKEVHAAAGYRVKPKSAKHAVEELIASVRKRVGTYQRSKV